MNIIQLFCHLKTFGKHYEPNFIFDNEYHCEECNLYLGTNYDQKLSCDNRKKLYKMWWETGGKSNEC